MVSRRELFRDCMEILKDRDSAQFDARCIFEDIFGDEYILHSSDEPVDEKTESRIRGVAHRCAEGYPLQYLLGKWEFYGLPFVVGEGVLIPRQDTETLVEFVTEYFKGRRGLRGVDLCAGSGCIGIALEKQLGCDITLIEKHSKAFRYLTKNIALNKSKAKPMLADVLLMQTADEFHDLDFVVSNPPYLTGKDMKNLQKQVTFEPSEALYGGEDGLDFYSEITRLWEPSLRPGGMLCYEIGAGQEDDVSGAMIQLGFENVRFIKDMCGIFRVVYGFKA